MSKCSSAQNVHFGCAPVASWVKLFHNGIIFHYGHWFPTHGLWATSGLRDRAWRDIPSHVPLERVEKAEKACPQPATIAATPKSSYNNKSFKSLFNYCITNFNCIFVLQDQRRILDYSNFCLGRFLKVENHCIRRSDPFFFLITFKGFASPYMASLLPILIYFIHFSFFIPPFSFLQTLLLQELDLPFFLGLLYWKGICFYSPFLCCHLPIMCSDSVPAIALPPSCTCLCRLQHTWLGRCLLVLTWHLQATAGSWGGRTSLGRCYLHLLDTRGKVLASTPGTH